MEIIENDRLVAPVYNQLLNTAIDNYLSAEPENLSPLDRKTWRDNNPKLSTADLSDDEFLSVSLQANRQPLNPVSIARQAIYKTGFPDVEELSERDIMDVLHDEFDNLKRIYEAGNVDTKALEVAWNVIHMTEAYISGYSRQIDRIAVRLLEYSKLGAKPYNALDRWHSKIWVPDEDMHDRVESFVMASTGVMNQEQFFREHIAQVKIGNHVDTSSFIGSNAFVALQEDATVITYENASRIYGSVIGTILLKLMANEAHHKRAYKSIHIGLLKEFPDQTVIATEKVSDEFDMPGREGIKDFRDKSKLVGYVGLLAPDALLASQRNLIEAMKLDSIQLNTDEAKIARDRLVEGSNYGQRKLRIMNAKVQGERQRSLENAGADGQKIPLIIGHTVFSEITKDGVSDPKIEYAF